MVRKKPEKIRGEVFFLGFLFLFFHLLIFPQTIRVRDSLITKIDLGGVEYVSLPRLVRALKGNLWVADDKIVCLIPSDSGEREIVCTLNSDVVVADEKTYCLSSPVIKSGDFLLFPALALSQIFSVVQEEEKSILSINLSAKRETTFLFLEVDTSVYIKSQPLSHFAQEIVVGAKTNLEALPPKGIVREIKLDREKETRFVFYFKRPSVTEVKRVKNGFWLKFYPQPEKNAPLIVLDPGHGGKDPGAIGKLSTLEKNLNLDIAKRLKRKLEKSGYRVLLTREDDRFVPLTERTNFANRNNADLFISIHCNASRDNPRAIGFETYFLSEARTDLERAQALKENRSLLSEENPFLSSELGLILSDLAQQEFLKESEELACCIQDMADAYLGLQNRGVRQAGFYVLRGALMPAVLVECGFLSNKREEKLLRNEKTRERISEAIFRGIKRFLLTYEKKMSEK